MPGANRQLKHISRGFGRGQLMNKSLWIKDNSCANSERYFLIRDEIGDGELWEEEGNFSRSTFVGVRAVSHIPRVRETEHTAHGEWLLEPRFEDLRGTEDGAPVGDGVLLGKDVRVALSRRHESDQTVVEELALVLRVELLRPLSSQPHSLRSDDEETAVQHAISDVQHGISHRRDIGFQNGQGELQGHLGASYHHITRLEGTLLVMPRADSPK